MGNFVDFEKVKAEVPIEQVFPLLNLHLTQRGEQFRGPCPVCEGIRTLVVTPERGLFFCFDCKKGGDVIALVSHIKGVGMKEAARLLAERFLSDAPKAPKAEPATGMKPLQHLEHDHDAVLALGFDAQIAEQLGIGYTGKGLMRGTVAVPVRLPDGTLAGYIGIQEARLPSRWQIPTSNVVPIKKPA